MFLRKKRFWLIGLAVVALLIVIVINPWNPRPKKVSGDPIHVAVVAPVTSERANDAQEIIRSVQLYFDKVNDNGGVDGKPLQLDVFDDKDDATTVPEVAEKIAGSNAVAVLGHLTSTTSLAGAPIYKKSGIPAITATATADNLTQGNPFYFRTVFSNSLQGSVLSLYTQEILQSKNVYMIASDDSLGQTLGTSFADGFANTGGLKGSWKFDPKAKDLPNKIQEIIDKLAVNLAEVNSATPPKPELKPATNPPAPEANNPDADAPKPKPVIASDSAKDAAKEVVKEPTPESNPTATNLSPLAEPAPALPNTSSPESASTTSSETPVTEGAKSNSGKPFVGKSANTKPDPAKDSKDNIKVDPPKKVPTDNIVFLSTSRAQAKEILYNIRRRGLNVAILGSDAIGRDTFPALFDQFVEEKQQPGFFVDGVYAGAPLIFDSAGFDAKEFVNDYEAAYKKIPSNIGAAYFDAAKVLVQAMQNSSSKSETKLFADSKSIAEQRKILRDGLEGINRREVAVKSLNGPLYFDNNHDSAPPVRIGKFEGRKFISAATQLSTVADLRRVDISAEKKAGNLFSLRYKNKNQFFWRQSVVYAGIDMNRLNRVDQARSSITADFYLWLRYSGTDNPIVNENATAIEFLDGLTNTQRPNQPIFEPKNTLQSGILDGLNYRLYRIKAEFRNSFDLRDYPFDTQKLNIRFQNTTIPSDRLIYVVDTLGLRLSNPDLQQRKKPFELQVWNFKDLEYAQDIFRSTSTLGNPDRFGNNSQTDFPGFNIRITLQRKSSVFLSKNLLPLLLLTIVVYATLYFPFSMFVPRIMGPASVLLSGIVLLLSLNNQLPEIGYTVAIEYVFYVYFFLCLFPIIITPIGDRLEKAGKKVALRRLNLSVRIIFPLVVLSTVINYWLLYRDRF